jgi:membrane protein implicated in regulation of membrane protease activity
MNWAAIIWLGLMLVFLIAEAACPLHLISIWFAVGALVAMVAALLAAPLALQVALFLVVSAALLALLWPVVRKFLNPSHVATNIDSVIGSSGTVTEDIDNIQAVGQVKLGAMYWTARSTSGAPIPRGTVVRADRIEGVKVYVSPAEVSASV